MSLNSGPYVDTITARVINLISSNGTKLRSITYDDTGALVCNVTAQNKSYVPIYQGISDPDFVPKYVAMIYNVVIGFNANVGSLTSATVVDGSEATFVINYISNNYVYGTFTTD